MRAPYTVVVILTEILCVPLIIGDDAIRWIAQSNDRAAIHRENHRDGQCVRTKWYRDCGALAQEHVGGSAASLRDVYKDVRGVFPILAMHDIVEPRRVQWRRQKH